MAIRLKDRNKQVPGGLKFLQAETGFSPYPYSSFDTIVRGLIVHRQANPFLKEKNGWSVDYEAVADEVDRFNAQICQQMGWGDYILDDAGESPKSNPPSKIDKSVRAAAGVVGKVATGMMTIASWLGSGGKPVPAAQSEIRAQVCVDCPKNGKGGLEAYFTKKAANLVRVQLEQRNQMSLSTTVDDKIGVCEACSCPLQLKVHTPLEHILAKMPSEDKANLDKRCWILFEEKA